MKRSDLEISGEFHEVALELQEELEAAYAGAPGGGRNAEFDRVVALARKLIAIDNAARRAA